MSTGSSYIYGLTLNAFGIGLTGPTGNTGSIGGIGPSGPSIRGNTGGTGPNLVNITKVSTSGYLRFNYTQNGVQFSETEILGNTGYAKVKLVGQTAGNAGDFHLVKTSVENALDSDGNFPVDILTVRGFSTNTPDYIKFEYSGGDPETVLKVSYNLINVGYIGISGGTYGNILQNLPGQFQYGITFTNYNEDENSIVIQHNNVQEGLNICRPTLIGTNIAYWKIDPSLASVFYMVPHGVSLGTNTQINGLIFFIKRPEYGNLSKGISLHFDSSFNIESSKIYYAVYDNDDDITSGITFASVFANNFDFDAITWQNESYFCPVSTKFNVLNMISLGNRYLAIPAQYNSVSADTTTEVTETNYITTCYPFETPTTPIDSGTLLGGLCCPSTCSGTIKESTLGGCMGFFIPTRTMASQSLCSRNGSCCVLKNGQYTQTQKTYCECMENALNATKIVWHPFEGLKTSLDNFDCSDLLVGVDRGACCDGSGSCSENTQEDCQQSNYFFQGLGVKCSGVNICAGGSGGCCDSGITCSNGITASTCLSENKTYLGDQKYCQSYSCSADTIPCFQTISGFPELKQGDEFAGGIVVGLFNLKQNSKAQIWGHRIFSASGMLPDYLFSLGPLLTESYGNETLSLNYKTIFDYGGYGFSSTSENLQEQNESFIIIVAKNDITVESDNKFLWSKGQAMWGPLFDQSNAIDSEGDAFITSDRKEGFIFNNGSPNSLAYSTLSTSTITSHTDRSTNNEMDWIYNRRTRSTNGKWSRNYGLMNTARMIGAKKAASVYGGQYNPTLTSSIPTVVDAIQSFNIANPATNSYESSWFIPSHDEMGFLSNLCQITTDFNLNSALALSDGGSIISGSYWTSTGTFDLLNGEGYTPPTDIIPSKAWIHNIDSDNPYNFTTNNSVASPRTEIHKVRPIKIIRCDGRFASAGDNNYRVWRLPNG
jgi:hypothetical protein